MFRDVITVLLPALLPLLTCRADSYTIEKSSDLVGFVSSAHVAKGQTLVEIGRENGVGYQAMIEANPNVAHWHPREGTEVVIAHRHILPSFRNGIVINLAELRLYFFQKSKSEPLRVATFPISAGLPEWPTPILKTKVLAKEREPVWIPTRSIRQQYLEEDAVVLPKRIEGGAPDNPLGDFALQLGMPEYLIHGVGPDKELGIGMWVTHGCIRMYPDDIEQLFALVKVGTPVTIIDAHVKAGKEGSDIYLEVHKSPEMAETVLLEEAHEALKPFEGGSLIDQKKVEVVVQRADGIPSNVSITAEAAARDFSAQTFPARRPGPQP